MLRHCGCNKSNLISFTCTPILSLLQLAQFFTEYLQLDVGNIPQESCVQPLLQICQLHRHGANPPVAPHSGGAVLDLDLAAVEATGGQSAHCHVLVTVSKPVLRGSKPPDAAHYPGAGSGFCGWLLSRALSHSQVLCGGGGHWKMVLCGHGKLNVFAST